MTANPTSTTTFLVVPALGRQAIAQLGAARLLVTRCHRVVVLGDASLADDVLAAGAEIRPSSDGRERTAPDHAADAAATSRAIAQVRPDAVVVAPDRLGALVAAECATVPLAVLVPPSHRLTRSERRLPAGLADLREGFGLAPVAGVAEQLERADHHIVDTSAALAAELEALPSVRPWVLVERHPVPTPVPATPRETHLVG